MQQLWILMRMVSDTLALGSLWSMCPLELSEQQIRGDRLAALAAFCALSGSCRLQEMGDGGSMMWALMLLAGSLTVGALILGIGRITGGKLGAGDGLLFLALGMELRPADLFVLAQGAFFLAALAGVIGRRKESLPLVPAVAVIRSIQWMERIVI